jgi:hypothetical protein
VKYLALSGRGIPGDKLKKGHSCEYINNEFMSGVCNKKVVAQGEARAELYQGPDYADGTYSCPDHSPYLKPGGSDGNTDILSGNKTNIASLDCRRSVFNGRAALSPVCTCTFLHSPRARPKLAG